MQVVEPRLEQAAEESSEFRIYARVSGNDNYHYSPRSPASARISFSTAPSKPAMLSPSVLARITAAS